MTEPTAGSIRPPCTREDADRVLRTLRENGHVAYFAGGCVRDLLLGLSPKDWDVATDAPPPRVRELFRKTQSVGAAFGVILVREGKSVVEVATFRSDGKYEDGRHPSKVTFTTAEADAQRRDFTINGLFLDPLENDKVIDYVGGREDINAKLIRAIGEPDRRFEEDHLRLLRAVRFAARFDFTIEPKTAEAIRKHAPQLVRISPERIAEELRLMLTPPTRVAAVRMLRELGLLSVILGSVPQHESADNGLFERVATEQPISFALALAALTSTLRGNDVTRFDRAMIRKLEQAYRTTLRISNDESAALVSIMDVSGLFAAAEPTVAMLKRFLAGPHAADARHLINAIESPRVGWLNEQFARFDGMDVAPPPLLTGDDLTAAGFRPGPKFKGVLDAVYDAQLDGRVTTRDEALAMARTLFVSR